ncbi:hypothetical protein [Neobacillus terrae]|uniref:hypothetical protein n=1 Tax=Neobacillus terrae TaxID=3034837 RepID=UPI00140BA074|nr:hypothetical protein [Neobacillus terrae]NHM30664.1 hypothetical protein [Neobacillus terrae]
MELNQLSFVHVTKELIESFLNSAKRRIIFAKPAFYESEIDLILNLQNEYNLLCKLYFESNDQSIRFGFGEQSALRKIVNQIESFSIEIVERIKLAILIVDEEILIYPPKIAFFDSNIEDFKNGLPSGLFGGPEITSKILEFFPPSQIQFKEVEEGPITILDIPIFEKEDRINIISNIEKTLDDLDKNPPTNPNNLRKVFIYRNKYKLVKYELQGIQISNKKLNLNPFIKLLDEQNERLKSSWNIFSKSDLEKLQDIAWFKREINFIVDDYLVDMGRFGYIISIDRKKEFEEAFEKVKTHFKLYIKGEAKEGNIFITEKSLGSPPNIKEILNSSKEELINYLINISENNAEIIIRLNRHLSQKVDNGLITTKHALREFISEFIDNKLRFPLEEEIIERIDIRIDYYDISNELLYENEDFRSFLNVHNLLEEDIRENTEGREVTKV